MEVDSILLATKATFRTTTVEKEVELQYDLGNLLATDLNPLNLAALKKSKDKYLKELARDNTQLLLNQLWELPTQRQDGCVLAELPSCVTVLPREKHIPQPKAPTKWDLFAKSKNIKNAKRSRMVFDENTQEWKPRWGYKRSNDPDEDWVIEVPDNADPYEDQFEKRRKIKDEAVAKNEYQRLKNIAQGQKRGVVKAVLPPPATKELKKQELTQAIGMAKQATASGGKFTPSLPKEPVPRRTKKRNFGPVVGNLAAERRRNVDILDKLSKKKTDTEDKTKKTTKTDSGSKNGPKMATAANKRPRTATTAKNRSKTFGAAKDRSKTFGAAKDRSKTFGAAKNRSKTTTTANNRPKMAQRRPRTN